MTLAAYFMDRHDSIDSVLELAFVLMNSQYGGKFLTTPDALDTLGVDTGTMGSDQESLVSGDLEACNA